jgi:hypothetical protein
MDSPFAAVVFALGVTALQIGLLGVFCLPARARAQRPLRLHAAQDLTAAANPTH